MLAVKVKRNYFQDALRLMQISQQVRKLEGVRNAVVTMATEKAKFALRKAGLSTSESESATGADLVMAVDGEAEKAARLALEKMEAMVLGGAAESERQAPDILRDELRAINIGLETFKEALLAQDVSVVQVNWEVPARGDIKLVELLKKMF
jgi:hypothetical protein